MLMERPKVEIQQFPKTRRQRREERLTDLVKLAMIAAAIVGVLVVAFWLAEGPPHYP